jgi:hypothetical protein
VHSRPLIAAQTPVWISAFARGVCGWIRGFRGRLNARPFRPDAPDREAKLRLCDSCGRFEGLSPSVAGRIGRGEAAWRATADQRPCTVLDEVSERFGLCDCFDDTMILTVGLSVRLRDVVISVPESQTGEDLISVQIAN